MAHQEPDVIVIGAGIIGISCALHMQQQGLKVLVVDRKGVAQEASKGNAGAFAFTDIVPLATPGIMKKAPKWLLDPLGPLSIPPSYALKIAPWMLKFWRASWQDRYEAAMNAQSQLMDLSRDALERQIVASDGEELFQREGQMQVYEGVKEFEAAKPSWQIRKDHGIRFELLESREAIAEIQPGLDPRFTHAGFTPDWMNVCDPLRWTEHLAASFTQAGGVIEFGDVTAMQSTSEGARMTLRGESESKELSSRRILVAAGAWSHKLARMVGDSIPLETERGYNTTLPEGAFDLRTHLTFSNHGFVVSRINGGIRVGGAAEMGGLHLPPNYKRSQILLDKAKKFLPELNAENGVQWMGFRPSMPDSLPVIGASPKSGHIVYAFGHGHLGLTQSAGTAELVTQLVKGEAPSLDLGAYAADRF